MTRIDLIDRSLLSQMADVGCKGLLYGIDSGSTATLSLIKKRMRREPTCNEMVKWHRDSGIVPTYYFLVDVPEETEADIEATVRQAARLSVLDPGACKLNLVRLVPGTPLAEATGDRLTLNVNSPYADTLMTTVGPDCTEVWNFVRRYPRIFSTYYIGPSTLGVDAANVLARFGSEMLERIPLTLATICDGGILIPTMNALERCVQHGSTINFVLNELADILKCTLKPAAELMEFEMWRTADHSAYNEILFSRVNYPAAVGALLSGLDNIGVAFAPEARLHRISAPSN